MRKCITCTDNIPLSLYAINVFLSRGEIQRREQHIMRYRFSNLNEQCLYRRT